MVVGAGCTEVGSIVPLLDLVEALEERDRDEDEDSLLAVADLDLINHVRTGTPIQLMQRPPISILPHIPNHIASS